MEYDGKSVSVIVCNCDLWWLFLTPPQKKTGKEAQLERGVEDINWGLNPPPNPYSHTAKTVTLSLKFKRSSDQFNSLDAYHLHKKSLFQLLTLAIFE